MNCHFPSKNRWSKQVKKLLEEFNPQIVVCHSLANTLWFWLCQEEMVEMEHLIMVSPPSLQTTESTIKSFFPCEIPQKIYAKKVDLIVSDNDPWIKLDEAKIISESIGANYMVIKNGGHFNVDSGYGKWELIEELISTPSCTPDRDGFSL